MREDGVRVDKFVLTTSTSYTPSGSGPAESGSCGTPATIGANRQAAPVDEFESEAGLRVTAYPNPFDDVITITVNPANENAAVRLIDLNGRTHRQTTLPANNGSGTIQAGTLPAGAYLIEVIRGNQRQVVPVRKF